MNIIVSNPREGRMISLGPIRMWVREDGTHTRGTLGIAEFEIPPNVPTPPPHIHHAHEEGFYVVEGEVEFLTGTETLRARQGAFVMVPIGVAHTFRNPTDRPVRFFNTFTPPRYLSYFEEMSQLMQLPAPIAPQQLAELMARYDTEVLTV